MGNGEMATLDENDRRRVWRGLMRRTAFGWAGLKINLRDAVDATDEWIDSNQGNYNAALPDAFRLNASLAQKTLLFCAVALARAGIGLLRIVFGEVD